jgi:hypothetical protein
MKVEFFIDGYYMYGQDWYYEKDFSIILDINFLPRIGELVYLPIKVYERFDKKFNSLSENEKFKLIHNSDRFSASDFIYVYNIYHDFSKNKRFPRVGLVANKPMDINRD